MVGDHHSRDGVPLQLSICIPTYNFGPYIGATLRSVIEQATEEVEIVVVDGGSTDDTAEIVAEFQRSFPRLTYVRRAQKGGIDNDMALTVEHARGRYCWLFSADDLMEEHAIETVLSKLGKNEDVILVETMLCSYDLKPVRQYPNLRLRTERAFNLSDPQQRRNYFALAQNTQPFFSFCGSLVINRERWNSSPWDRSFIGSCWAHAARLFALLPSGLTVRHVPGALSRKRMGNDSFAADGLVKRVQIGIDGYCRIAHHFFGDDSPEAAHIRRALRAEYSLLYMIAAKIETIERGRAGERELLDSLFARIYESALLRGAYRRSPMIVWRVLSLLRRAAKRCLRR